MGIIIVGFLFFVFLSAKDGDETAQKISIILIIIFVILALINDICKI